MNKNPAKIRKTDREFEKQLDVKDKKFNFQKKIIQKLKKYIILFISVFDYKDRKPHHIRTSKQTFVKLVDC